MTYLWRNVKALGLQDTGKQVPELQRAEEAE